MFNSQLKSTSLAPLLCLLSVNISGAFCYFSKLNYREEGCD